MVLGAKEGPQASKVFLVDLGLASKWATRSQAEPAKLQPHKYDQRPDDFRCRLLSL